MKNYFEKISYLLDSKLKLRFYILVLFTIIASLLEYLSLAALFPSIVLITKNKNNELDDNIFNNLIESLNFQNPELIFIVIFFLIYLIKLIFLFLIIILQNKFIYLLKKNISDKISKTYLNSDLLYQVQKKTSDMITILTDEIAQVGQLYFHLIMVLTDIFLIFSISIFLFILNFKATFFIFLVLFAVLIIYQIAVKKIVSIKARDRQEHFSNRIYLSNFIIKAFKEIKIFKKENYFLKLFEISTVKNFKSHAIISIIQSIPRLFIELILLFSIIGFLLLIVLNNLNLEVYLPIIGIYLFATIRLMPTFTKISSSINLINFCKPSLNLIHREIKNSVKKNQLEHNKNKKLFFRKYISIHKLSFSYPNKKVFENLNFKIKKNKINIIAGRSGSGKTTLLNILMGLITTYNGKILIDNYDIKNFGSKWIEKLAFIPQDINLLNSDIRSNIAFGENIEDIDDNKIKKIIKLLDFKYFISQLSMGLKTKVGDHGKLISGGQIQKIAIARALYKDAEILIFDEPTSSLDKKSVQEFIKNIKKITKNKTIVIVTHDPTVIKNFKNVFLIEN
jgi:ABC-type multidrug transport system fused ATPase/permease subunit